jgi:hypothetical protein
MEYELSVYNTEDAQRVVWLVLLQSTTHTQLAKQNNMQRWGKTL